MPANKSVFSSPQWRDSNHFSRYPFTDSSSLQYSAEDYLPIGTFVDARLYLPGLTGVVSLLNITVTATQVILSVGKQNSASNQATAIIDGRNPQERISVRSVSGDICGCFVSGQNQWAELLSLPRGSYDIIPGTADFLPAVTVSIPANTQRLLDPAGLVVGDVIRLVGENGVRLDCVEDAKGLTIRAHAVGEPLYRITECDVDVARASQVIERVVFKSGSTTVDCMPDDRGRIFILPDTHEKQDSALRVQTVADGIDFSLLGKSLEK